MFSVQPRDVRRHFCILFTSYAWLCNVIFDHINSATKRLTKCCICSEKSSIFATLFQYIKADLEVEKDCLTLSIQQEHCVFYII